jgi:hypothetical protein
LQASTKVEDNNNLRNNEFIFFAFIKRKSSGA